MASPKQAEPRTESAIRPIFGSVGSFTNRPKVRTQLVGNGESFSMQPPKGETWRLLYASCKFSTAASGTIEVATYIVDGATAFLIQASTTGTRGAGNEITGTNPMLLTNDQYIRFDVTASGGGQASAVGVFEVL